MYRKLVLRCAIGAIVSALGWWTPAQAQYTTFPQQQNCPPGMIIGNPPRSSGGTFNPWTSPSPGTMPGQGTTTPGMTSPGTTSPGTSQGGTGGTGGTGTGGTGGTGIGGTGTGGTGGTGGAGTGGTGGTGLGDGGGAGGGQGLGGGGGGDGGSSVASGGPSVGGAGVGGSSVSATGYIDSAMIRSWFRLRYDAAFNNPFADRAEFFYAKCGCFRAIGVDPKANGPLLPERRVDYQDLSAYLELAASENWSGFVELPYRWINPDQNPNQDGIGDFNFGFKYAFINNETAISTFQLKAYAPTGSAPSGLGTDHFSLEPGFLTLFRISDALTLEAELRDWIPIGGTNFAGNVLRYGVGVSYAVVQTERLRIAPVAEFVGWSVLSGGKFSIDQTDNTSATGDTIVNMKLGVRATIDNGTSLYIGYGRGLTGDIWYRDIVRAELRLAF